MKTIGDRIKQARKFRGLSGEELAIKVGYKTQSGISNLENRWTGKGGYKLPAIAKALNFSVQWFLDGPDTEDMATVPPFDVGMTYVSMRAAITQPMASQPEPLYPTNRQMAHQLLDQLSEAGVLKAIDHLSMLQQLYPIEPNNSAGVFVPAQVAKTA